MGTFPSMLAIDASGNAAGGAVGQVFATDDISASTPLSPVDLFGLAFAGNNLIASSLGILPSFRVAGHTAVDWVSGSFRLTIPCIDQVPAGGTSGQVLAKASGSDYDIDWINSVAPGGTVGQVLAKTSNADFDVDWVTPAAGGTGGGGTFASPAVLQQTARSQTILSVRSVFGGVPSTGDANMLEARNSIESGTAGVGQLVFYLNEEAFPRVQNALNSKTLIRIRNWGTNVNAFQVTDSGGSTVLFNIRADDGFVTAPNIGLPVRAILAAGQQPAVGAPEGIYLRRLS